MIQVVHAASGTPAQSGNDPPVGQSTEDELSSGHLKLINATPNSLQLVSQHAALAT